MKKKILILSGGISKERLISLDTGNQVAKELKKIIPGGEHHILFWNNYCEDKFSFEKLERSCFINDMKNNKTLIIFLHQKNETLQKINHYEIYNYFFE